MKNENQKQEKEGKRKSAPSAIGNDDKIKFAVKENANISRETISEWLRQDVRRVHIFMTEILENKFIFEQLTEVYWKRYQDLHKKSLENQPELFDDAV